MTQAHVVPTTEPVLAAANSGLPATSTALFPRGESVDGAPVLDAEKLVAYHLALELQVLASSLVPVNHRVLQDQIERASLSVVLCVAEGAGRRSRKDKQRFYAMARGSATEVAAAVDVLRVRRLAPEGSCRTARSLALRVVQVLTKLHSALT